MLTRKQLAERWGTSVRTVDRRVRQRLLRFLDLTRGLGKRPQIRFSLDDVLEYERKARLGPDPVHIGEVVRSEMRQI